MKKRMQSLALACMLLSALLLPVLALAAPADVDSLRADTPKLTLVAGETSKLAVTVSPTQYRPVPLAYSTSKSSVATVDEKGIVTAVKKGTATITIQAENGAKTTVAVRVVSKGEPTGITLNYNSLEMAVKGTDQLVPTLTPKEGVTGKNQAVSYKSSNSKVVKADKKGNLTAVKKGTATITAKTRNGLTATCTVQVSNITIAPTKIQFASTNLSLPAGSSEQLQVAFTPTNTTEKALTYASSNTNVATVDKNGKVTGIKQGNATITATTANGKSARCNITVAADKSGNVTGIALQNSDIALLVNESKALAYTVQPTNAKDKAVTFSSSNKSIATVDSKGNVKALKPGTAVITIQSKNGVSAQCTVTVTKSSVVPVTNLNLSTNRLELNINESATLAVQVLPRNATDQSLTFIAKNGTVASVDKNGKVTGLRAGETTIDVFSSNEMMVSCKVVVKAKEEIQITRIQLNSTTVRLKLKETFALVPSVAPYNATSTGLTYTSDDSSIASVNSSGVITAARAGETAITVKAPNGISAVCFIYVEEAAAPAPETFSSYAEEVLYYVNIERENAGLRPLQLHGKLTAAAQVRAKESTELFEHKRPDGRSIATAFTEAGITSYSTAGENLAAGQRSPEAVVQGWMSSSGHRANILNSRYTYMGLGYVAHSDRYGHYWAQLFMG